MLFESLTIPDLPPIQKPSTPAVYWEEIQSGEAASEILENAYYKAVHWLPNIFTIPLGAVGKRFVDKVTLHMRGFVEGSALKSILFWAVMVMPQLLLQEPTEPPSPSTASEVLGVPFGCMGHRLI